MNNAFKALSTGTQQVPKVSPSPSVSILFSFLPKERVQTETRSDCSVTSQNISNMNSVLDVFIYPDLNMKLTLNSFLDKTLNSKRKQRDGDGKRVKKTKEAQ